MPLVVVYIGGGSASRLLVQRTVSRLRLLQINRLEFYLCCTGETICLVSAPGLPTSAGQQRRPICRRNQHKQMNAGEGRLRS